MTTFEWSDAEREAAWDAGMAVCDCHDYPDPERTDAVLAALAPFVEARVRQYPVEVERLTAELEAERAKVARVEALLSAEIADDTEAHVRREVGDVRCPDCGLRYEERQEYGCHESGRGHSYDADDLARAEESARAEVVEYVTLAVTDLRHALGAPDAP